MDLRIVTASGLVAIGLTLAGCAREQAPLSVIEMAIWDTEVRDVIPRPPELQALQGKPGHPDYERPRAKGRAVLRFVPIGTPADRARALLAGHGFRLTAAGDETSWLQVEKEWCRGFKCCVTNIGLQLRDGRVADARAYDYQNGPWNGLFAIQNTYHGPAECV